MDTIGTAAEHIHELLGDRADQLGRQTGLIQRERTLTGSGFARLLVGGWLNQPQGSIGSLCRLGAAQHGIEISVQGLDKRFSAEAAELMRRLVGEAAQRVVSSAQPRSSTLLERFSSVWLVDTTVLALPASLAEHWSGTGSRNGVSNTAALKAELALDLKGGTLLGPDLLPGRAHDSRGHFAQSQLPPQSLRIADLGYFSLEQFAQIQAHDGYFLSRLRSGTHVAHANGEPLDLLAHLQSCARQGLMQTQLSVRLGKAEGVQVRLLAIKAPPEVAAQRRRRRREAAQAQGRTPRQGALALEDWTLLVTNVPATKLSVEEALSLYAARWQIERLFKLWKSHGGLGHSHSQKPQRILTECYARLLGLLFQHWLMLSAWSIPALSQTKAAELVRVSTPALMLALNRGRSALRKSIADIARGLRHECRINRRRKHPSTAQTLNGEGLPWGLS